MLILASDEKILLKASRISIRDLFYLSLVKDGYIELRASAYVDKSGMANLYIGESNSGKTTLLIKALSESGNYFMANGRVFIKYKNGRLIAVGTPESIALRGFTYELFNQFTDLKEDFINISRENERLKMSLKDFCKYLNTDIRIYGEVQQIELAKLGSITSIDSIKAFNFNEYIDKTDIYGLSRLRERYWLTFFSYDEIDYMKNVQEIKEILKLNKKRISYRNENGICSFNYS